MDTPTEENDPKTTKTTPADSGIRVEDGELVIETDEFLLKGGDWELTGWHSARMHHEGLIKVKDKDGNWKIIDGVLDVEIKRVEIDPPIKLNENVELSFTVNWDALYGSVHSEQRPEGTAGSGTQAE